LNPARNPDRPKVMAALKEADIGFRMITGGCFPRHDVMRFFDCDFVGEMTNGDIAHDYGFFVGNHPFDLTPQIDKLWEVLDSVCD
jgi:CDP-6-deoxy-D-xylo-4-hexulose-3-dehydrase